MDKPDILMAQSPAALAEEFLIKSIWSNRFPAGSDLPAERELADIIGVTRTTLREVLQRLARDGWLTIQHGKATRVNNVWETAGPNIISTIIRLDPTIAPTMIANVVSLRTRMAEYYIPEAIKMNIEGALNLFQSLEMPVDNAAAYAAYDYALYRGFTFVANKPVYALILNSFKDLYLQIASLFFKDPNCRKVTLQLYYALKKACEEKDYVAAVDAMAANRQHSSKIWAELLKQLPQSTLY